MYNSRGVAVDSRARFALVFAFALFLLATLSSGAQARPASPAPPLPAPTGTIVNVSTAAQLQAAVQNLASNTTVVLAPGTYTLTSTLWINGSYSNVAIRGSSNDPNATVIVGPGMTNASYGNVPYGIWTGGNVQGVLIANLTLRNFYYHAIIFNGVTQSPHVYNVHLLDTGEQLIKSNPDGAGGGVNNGIVEYSTIEYTTTSKDYYTNGVDVYTGSNWIIRHNLFRNIVAPAGQLAGPAVLAWAHSANTIAEGNTFINCARGISFGLQDVSGFDHSGGVIRNNMFYRASNQPGDVGIAVFDSPNTLVENNTVFVSGTYGTPIEYRFANTTGVVIKNNLLDGIVFARDGATGTVADNLAASAGMFVNAAAGDLHLSPSATSAIDAGQTLASVTDDWDGQIRPAGVAYDVGADEYAATTTTYGISGHVRNASSTGLAGVTMTLGGSRSLTASSDAAGAFAFTGLASGGTYTVTPSAAGYAFTPGQLTYAALNANVANADFSGAATAPTPTPPPPPSASGPYGGTPAAIPGTIEAENYDLGGEGVAYHDTTAGNSGNVYRTDGVDLIAASDTGGGYEVTNAVAGEWLKYSVKVGSAGTYTITVRVASSGTGGQFHIELDGVNATGAMSVPNTRGWQTWQTITKTGVSLTSGAHVMRLVLDTNGSFTRQVGHFNWIHVDGAATPTPTPHRPHGEPDGAGQWRDVHGAGDDPADRHGHRHGLAGRLLRERRSRRQRERVAVHDDRHERRGRHLRADRGRGPLVRHERHLGAGHNHGECTDGHAWHDAHGRGDLADVRQRFHRAGDHHPRRDSRRPDRRDREGRLLFGDDAARHRHRVAVHDQVEQRRRGQLRDHGEGH